LSQAPFTVTDQGEFLKSLASATGLLLSSCRIKVVCAGDLVQVFILFRSAEHGLFWVASLALLKVRPDPAKKLAPAQVKRAGSDIRIAKISGFSISMLQPLELV